MSRKWVLLISAGVLILGGIGYELTRAIKAFTASGFTGNIDQQFGEQYLKTAVALIELHHVRTGYYPEDLSKLRFIGQWDVIAVQSVRYIVAPDHLSYYVEVQRGWIGKPKLDLPADFWRGTGYNAKLAAEN